MLSIHRESPGDVDVACRGIDDNNVTGNFDNATMTVVKEPDDDKVPGQV